MFGVRPGAVICCQSNTNFVVFKSEAAEFRRSTNNMEAFILEVLQ